MNNMLEIVASIQNDMRQKSYCISWICLPHFIIDVSVVSSSKWVNCKFHFARVILRISDSDRNSVDDQNCPHKPKLFGCIGQCYYSLVCCGITLQTGKLSPCCERGICDTYYKVLRFCAAIQLMLQLGQVVYWLTITYLPSKWLA